VPVSKHRRKNKKNLRRKGACEADDLVMFKHPFSNIPHDEVIKGLIEAGRSYQAEFPSKLDKVTKLIQSTDALQAIACLSIYGLFAGISDNGKTTGSYKGESFTQSHVELIQAIALQIEEDKRYFNPPTPEIIQELFDALPELASAFHYQRFIQLEVEKSKQNKSILILQEHLRSHTQLVRNWGFLKRVIAIAKRLYEPMNSNFEDSINIGAPDLIDVFSYLVARLEKMVNRRWIVLRTVFSLHKPEEIITAYYKENPHFMIRLPI